MVHREYSDPQYFCSQKYPTDCSFWGALVLLLMYCVYLGVNKRVADGSGKVDDDGVE